MERPREERKRGRMRFPAPITECTFTSSITTGRRESSMLASPTSQRKTTPMGKLNRLFSSGSTQSATSARSDSHHTSASASANGSSISSYKADPAYTKRDNEVEREPRSHSNHSGDSVRSTSSTQGGDSAVRGISAVKSTGSVHEQGHRHGGAEKQQSNSHSSDMSRASSIRSVRSKQSTSVTNAHTRFRIHSDGCHEHHLKCAKRQEKLGQMVKSWLGAGSGSAKKQSTAVSAVPDLFLGAGAGSSASASVPSGDGIVLPPTLLSTYLQQQQNGGHGPTETQQLKEGSLHEKYGRCQEVLGRGTFGVVRLSHKKIGPQETLYAVKEFTRKEGEADTKYSKRLTSEFCISSSLKHLNIIAAYDLFRDASGGYCEVMEYCSGGDLYSLIVSAGKLEYIEADCFFKQLVRAVHYMHEMGVAHRDLKPENVLLTQDGTVKVTDFGSAECFRTAWEDENDVTLSRGLRGSSPYIAPEAYTEKEYDPRGVDVWACGVIYMAMRTGRQLWKEAHRDDDFYAQYCRRRRCESGYEPIESLKRARCRNVIYSVLDPAPARRITTRQVLNSEWVREIRCCRDG